ncbi:uroporphyrinogen decarboxylase family protein [candidate division KSB1 bacterium]
MNGRQRVLAAINHREPDRVPLDLGGMDSTGIVGLTYNRLKSYLGISDGSTDIVDVTQQVAKVETTLLDWAGADCRPFYYEPNEWMPGELPDGSPCRIPAGWTEETEPNGDRVVRDSRGRISLRMPVGGYYFEPVNPPYAAAGSIAEIEADRGYIDSFDWPFFCDESWAQMGQRARKIRGQGDYAVIGNFAGHIFAAGQLLRGYEQFLVDLALDPGLAGGLMDMLVEVYIERFKNYWDAVGDNIDIISVNDDLGTQLAAMISPDMYRRLVKPRHRKLFGALKEISGVPLFLHSDGVIVDLMPDLVEIGVDILNPVQYTLPGMDSGKLKREFGRDLCFWGAGCDTQRILPAGSPQEVADEVKRQVETLAPGGGYVFTQVHNIQADVSPKNIEAMYEAAHQFGKY